MIKKWLQSQIYLQIAIGRKNLFLRLLEHLAPNVPEEDPENVRCREWLHAQNPKRISVTSRDGLMLIGYYLEHPQAKRIVLMFHGWRGGWDRDCAALARGLYELNCSVLIVNQRAQGESEGKYIGFGVLERYDCLSWLQYLDSQTEALPIYLYGVSMGAATVLMAAGEVMPERVEGIIGDCGYTSPYEMAKIFSEKFLKLDGEELTQTVDEVNALCLKKAGYDFREFSTLDAMPHCRIPVFFVHGTADDFVPYEMTEANYEACAAKKTLYAADGAGHAQSYLTNPKRYLAELKQFFGW